MAYNRGIIVPEILAIHEAYNRIFLRLASLERNPRTRPQATKALRDLRAAYLQFNRDLNRLATYTAGYATRQIKTHLKQSLVRPATGKSPRLQDAIKSRRLIAGPLATGIVQIADEDELDKVVNPFSPSWGPYWRAIEKGIDFSGREIRGFFTAAGGGHPWSPPQAQYRGGGGPHPIFRARATGPAGTISRPIKPHRFIEKGANDAAGYFRAEFAVIQNRALAGIERAQRDILAAL